MQYADFVGLLRTLLIILLIYYGVKFVLRLAFPYLMRSFAGKVERKFKEQQQYQQHQQKTKVGETTIDKRPAQQENANNSVGEYTDYEEIE